MTPSLDLDVAPFLDDHIKVRLYYQTHRPRHLRSFYLRTEAEAKPPFLECVSVLVPVMSAYNRLSAYSHIFHALIGAGVLSTGDQLTRFEVTEEDAHTLAYFEPVKG